MRRLKNLARLSFSGLIALFLGASVSTADQKRPFTTDFNLQSCSFAATGRNPYFILVPGYRLVFEGTEKREEIDLEITVLSDLEAITLPGIGEIMTRVVEERESVDGSLKEVSRNFFAICEPTNSVFYFGEDVDFYEDGQIVGHGGSWRAGVNGALPGIAMPGTFLLGSRYAQEIAPGVAMDRAENWKMGLTVDVPAGHFVNVVQVKETNALESNSKEFKLYAPGIGLIVDDVVKLVEVFDPDN